MNRITHRILASKDFTEFKDPINNAQVDFQADVDMVNEKFDQLLNLLATNDKTKINKLLADMISDLNAMSTNLFFIKQKINSSR